MGKSENIAENQRKEGLRKYKVELINKNLLENYEKIINKENIKGIINNQKKFVILMDLPGKYKNRHYSILLLEQYHNSKNKNLALQQLENSLRNKKLFSK
jgi:hypothetical protein